MSRKNMPLIVGGAAFGILAAVLGWFTWSAISSFSESEDALSKQTHKLDRLRSRVPFPSAENAEVLSRQEARDIEYLKGLGAEMRKAQSAVGSITRDRWQGEFGQVLRAIAQGARARGVNLPPAASGFLFGFERYRETIPMDAAELARLFPQLQGVSQLCRTLFECGITELVSVEREQFEVLSPAGPADDEDESPRARRRRAAEAEAPAAAPSKAPFRDKDGLFTREHYVLAFRAKDEAIWNVLAKFAQQIQPFVVVTKLDILNAARPAVLPPRGAEPDASAPGPSVATVEGFRAFGAPVPAAKEPEGPLPRELRVVAGDTLPLARIEVDIYRFAEDSAATADESAEEPS
jgi:hypothetical protein